MLLLSYKLPTKDIFMSKLSRPDDKYQQNYSGDTLNFSSEWQEWYLEYSSKGYARLHLKGMRRCDGTDTECNTPGGGLPIGSVAINPCEPEYVYEVGEVVLFVTGYANSVPRGIVLRQARLAGSDWDWGYQLQKQPVISAR